MVERVVSRSPPRTFFFYFFFVFVLSFLFPLFFLAVKSSKQEKVRVKKKKRQEKKYTHGAARHDDDGRRKLDNQPPTLREPREKTSASKISLASVANNHGHAGGQLQRTDTGKGSGAGFLSSGLKIIFCVLLCPIRPSFSRVWSTCRRTSRYLRCRDVFDSVHLLKNHLTTTHEEKQQPPHPPPKKTPR
jgi:hypothetical protein